MIIIIANINILQPSFPKYLCRGDIDFQPNGFKRRTQNDGFMGLENLEGSHGLNYNEWHL